jgi:PTS system mannose-specific IID component
MQNLGWAFSLIPAIKKLYKKPEDRAAALERHMEFFNTHPYVASPIIGVTLSLEEQRANGADIDDVAIQGVKIGMMGPLAGIGDPVFWFTVRPILGALGASLALSGNIMGPILFFVLWNVIRWAFLWYTQEFGYKAGSSITQDLSGGILKDITKGASILGMFVLAVLVQRWVSIKFTLELAKKTIAEGAYNNWNFVSDKATETVMQSHNFKGSLTEFMQAVTDGRIKLSAGDHKILDKLDTNWIHGAIEKLQNGLPWGSPANVGKLGAGFKTPITLQDNLDQLIPGLMGLLLTLLCMYLLKKKVSPIVLIIGLLVVGVVMHYFGIM